MKYWIIIIGYSLFVGSVLIGGTLLIQRHFAIDWDNPPKDLPLLKNKQVIKSSGQLEDEAKAEFERFLDAIEWVERKGDPNAIGAKGEVGAYQLTKAYVDDVDSRFQQKYGMSVFDYSDRYDKEKSRSMVILYFQHYGRYIVPEPASWEPYARIHNGGPDGWRNDPLWFVRNRNYTLEQAEKKIKNCKEYWLKVKAVLDKQ